MYKGVDMNNNDKEDSYEILRECRKLINHTIIETEISIQRLEAIRDEVFNKIFDK